MTDDPRAEVRAGSTRYREPSRLTERIEKHLSPADDEFTLETASYFYDELAKEHGRRSLMGDRK